MLCKIICSVSNQNNSEPLTLIGRNTPWECNTVKRDNNTNTLVDVVYGGKAIGRVINESKLQRVYYHLSREHIPGATKLGTRWALSVPAWRRAMHLDK
jgi:hypothetical protein